MATEKYLAEAAVSEEDKDRFLSSREFFHPNLSQIAIGPGSTVLSPSPPHPQRRLLLLPSARTLRLSERAGEEVREEDARYRLPVHQSSLQSREEG